MTGSVSAGWFFGPNEIFIVIVIITIIIINVIIVIIDSNWQCLSVEWFYSQNEIERWSSLFTKTLDLNLHVFLYVTDDNCLHEFNKVPFTITHTTISDVWFYTDFSL